MSEGGRSESSKSPRRARTTSCGSLRSLITPAWERSLSLGSSSRSSTVFRRQENVERVARKGLQLRLWYVLLLVFVANVLAMASVMSLFWYNRSTHAVQEFLNSSNATWERTIENITRQLHQQASWLEDSIVTDILVEPVRAVELNIDLLSTVRPSLEDLLNYSFIQLSKRFEKIEGISYTFPTGQYIEYERNSLHPGVAWRRGNYTFEYGPGSHLDASECPVMCPNASANVSVGYTHQFSVDDKTGKYVELLEKYPWSVLSGNAYQRAVEANGATIWTEPFVMASSTQIGLRAAQALVEDGEVTAVAGADITLDYLSSVLEDFVLAQHGRVYILDRTGRMIASSGGSAQVIGYDRSGHPLMNVDNMQQTPSVERLHWNRTGDPIIEEGTRFLIKEYDLLTRKNTKVVAVDENGENIYSAFEVDSGSNAYGIDWIIVNAQALSTYKAPIEETINKHLQDHEATLDRSVSVSVTMTVAFVAIGTLMMALVAHAVTRPLRAIETDMRAVANFDNPAIDQILGDSTRHNHGTIREVADICDSFKYMAIGLQSFSRYMDPHLAQTLVKTKRRATLGMVKADVTVFFSDIAGFTTMAENLDPEALMGVLAQYLQDMSSIVMKHGGVVGEFIGDEIMAWWNAPPLEFDGKQHTVAALSAALEQQQRLAELREHWSEQGLPGFTVRMGLVRGQALAGNLGSTTRMKYGLVGDNVNLASRLEGLCKMYGVGCLVDDGVRLAPGVPEHFVFRSVDLVSVKGRKNATEIFELVAKRGTDALAAPSSLAFSADFAAVQEQYRQGDFTGALVALESFESRWPGDKPASILRDRCEKLLKYPPGNDWSPMVQLHEK